MTSGANGAMPRMRAAGSTGPTKPHAARSTTWLPLAAAGATLATILLCYRLSRAYLPEDLTTPFVSTMGLQPPAVCVYGAGFAVVGVLWIMSASVVSKTLRAISGSRAVVQPVYWLQVAAGAGLLLQGIIPLQPDYVDLMLAGELGSAMAPQSTLHVACAFVFFLASIAHHLLAVRIYWCNHALRSALGPVALLSLAIKVGACSLGLLVFALLLSVNPDPGVPHTEAELGSAGILQYTFILTILVFMASYSPDLYFLPC